MNANTPPERTGTLVVGAGLSGLACARHLQAAGKEVHVLEAADAVGGRVRTDEVDGFRLDRGFQVLLTAYSEVPKLVDLKELRLKPFGSGSLIWTGTSLERLADPWRHPAAALGSAMSRVGTLGDKLKVAKLRRELTAGSDEACFQGEERSTVHELGVLGFSDEFIDQFFRPFLGGVFLERALETSAFLFRYYFRCFALGDAAVPALGMQRLPEVLAHGLETRISFGTKVTGVTAKTVTLQGGDVLHADDIVLATDAGTAARLTGDEIADVDFKGAVTSYFAAPSPPVDDALLILDGEGTGPANNVAVMSNVSPDYAPAGRALIAVSGVDEAANDAGHFEVECRPQLRRWFGATVDSWTLLRSYSIPDALPRHPVGSMEDRSASPRGEDGIIVAGDYREFGAIQGAFMSGRRAAEAVLAAGSAPESAQEAEESSH